MDIEKLKFDEKGLIPALQRADNNIWALQVGQIMAS